MLAHRWLLGGSAIAVCTASVAAQTWSDWGDWTTTWCTPSHPYGTSACTDTCAPVKRMRKCDGPKECSLTTPSDPTIQVIEVGYEYWQRPDVPRWQCKSCADLGLSAQCEPFLQQVPAAPGTMITRFTTCPCYVVHAKANIAANHTQYSIGGATYIGASAIIGAGVNIGSMVHIRDVQVDPNENSAYWGAIINENSTICQRTKIESQTTIGAGVVVGNCLYISDVNPSEEELDHRMFMMCSSDLESSSTTSYGTTIDQWVTVGDHTTLGCYTELGLGAHIGRDVTITAGLFDVDQEFSLGDFSRISSDKFRAKDVVIGSNVLISAMSFVVNKGAQSPDAGDTLYIGDNVAIQANITIDSGKESCANRNWTSNYNGGHIASPSDVLAVCKLSGPETIGLIAGLSAGGACLLVSGVVGGVLLRCKQQARRRAAHHLTGGGENPYATPSTTIEMMLHPTQELDNREETEYDLMFDETAPMERWTGENVAQWIRNQPVDLREYAALFLKNGVTGRTLSTLPPKDLERMFIEMGIAKIGHRALLLTKIEDVKKCQGMLPGMQAEEAFSAQAVPNTHADYRNTAGPNLHYSNSVGGGQYSNVNPQPHYHNTGGQQGTSSDSNYITNQFQPPTTPPGEGPVVCEADYMHTDDMYESPPVSGQSEEGGGSRQQEENIYLDGSVATQPQRQVNNETSTSNRPTDPDTPVEYQNVGPVEPEEPPSENIYLDGSAAGIVRV